MSSGKYIVYFFTFCKQHTGTAEDFRPNYYYYFFLFIHKLIFDGKINKTK